MIKSGLEGYYKIQEGLDDLKVLAELDAAQEELDLQTAKVLEWILAEELKGMLSNEGDSLGALLKINSGAGGTESNDWSAMLMRMYRDW